MVWWKWKKFCLLQTIERKLTSTIFLCPTGPYKCIDKKDCFQWFDPTQEEKEIIFKLTIHQKN